MATKTTIHDIASFLNITASTVSRALNNNPRISENTRKAVLKAAKQLNYQPNNIAAALRNGKSNLIGVIVPTADRAFFASVVRGIEEVANELDYKIIICQSYDDYNKEIQTVEALANARVDGVIASIGKETLNFEHYNALLNKGIPIVLFDRTTDQLAVNQVMIDDYEGAYEAVSHLISEGCKRIAHFTSPIKISIYKERLRGYTDALKDHGVPFDQDLVLESNLQLEDGRQSMLQLLELREIPDAIFSASDYGAMGAMQVLKEKNIKIPQQVALVGFANEPFTSFTDPTLTTVDQLSLTMGHVTGKLFFDQLNSQDKNGPQRMQKTILKPKLIVRQSSLRSSLEGSY
ncbi:LacI family DNA-binding transcriptional regulator [Fulvivirga kasyanovii]|uniref:LacI family transcriptional regulator n=1 Tax=Fulvivirga kasyanovii TaxID=396812 RepID=A0ABW9S044_9BACT|nr:LacI family DNA-binding transcriptional regulator [Fulvivirga kasyanovii]MTI28830.1 LacI family transcriptional regulator [Fulvivirga kasyanovii]